MSPSFSLGSTGISAGSARRQGGADSRCRPSSKRNLSFKKPTRAVSTDRRRAVNDTKPMPSSPKRRASWAAMRSRRAILLFVGGGAVVVAGAAWAIFNYWHGTEGKAELLTYRLCVGREQKLCPNDATFVQNVGEDAVAKWAQRECASYRTRRIIINDGPTKDCDCYVADVSCSSE